MTERRATDVPGLSPARIAALLALNAVPLLGFLPIVAHSSAGTVSGDNLLPIVVLPTVIVAVHGRRSLYLVQLALASVVCAVTAIEGSRSAWALAAGALTTIGTLAFTVVLIGRSRRALVDYQDGLRLAGLSDPLTGVLNRRGAVDGLQALVADARRMRREVGIAAIDLDHFKRVNDTLGHAAGDAVIRAVCDVARAVAGPTGMVVRSGGEEILLITIGDAAPVTRMLMDRLAARTAEPAVTVSAGVIRADAAALVDADSLWAAVGVADLALYRAKAMGRNRIVEGGDWFGVRVVAAPAVVQRTVRALPTEQGDVATGPAQHSARAAAHQAVPTDHPRRAAGSAAIDHGGRNPRARWNRWRHSMAEAIARAKGRAADPAVHRLYRLIVAWTMMVGIITTALEMISGTMPLAQGLVMLPAGWIFGAVLIVWMSRLSTSWALTPIFVVGSLFEMVVVFTVAVDSRPSALMLSLLVGLLVVLHWPRAALVVQSAVTLAACFGAALMPLRPLSWTVAIAAVTGVALVAALVVVAAQRRREESAEGQLHHAASTDPLTGLSNRRELDGLSRSWNRGCLAMVDVDRFKDLNDQRGHAYGDDVLRAVAEALLAATDAVGGGCRAFRIGGDEFVLARVLQADGRASATRAAADTEAAERLVIAVQAAAEARALPVSLSVGAAAWHRPVSGTNLWTALAAADEQLLRRKRAARVGGPL